MESLSLVNIKIFGKDIICMRIGNRKNWEAVKIIAGTATHFEDKNWFFKYQDEEGDIISGSTEIEWQAALFVCEKNRMAIEIHPLMDKGVVISHQGNNQHLIDDFVAKDKESNVLTSLQKESNKCCSQIKTTCCSSINTGCCNTSGKNANDLVFKRPMPEPYIDDGVPTVKIVNETLSEYKYTNEALRAVTLPLGPLGGGNIAVAGDGGLRQWQINNKVAHNAQLPDSFFAIKIDNASVILQSNKWYDQTGFKPAPIVTDHVVPPSSMELLSKCPGVETVEITAKYPVVEVDYIDTKYLSNVSVHLEAWSPKIPSNSQASGVPAVIFDFYVTNKASVDLEISLLASVQNMVGWNAHDSITDEVNVDGYGGNVNSFYESGNLYGIDMSNTSLLPLDDFNGHAAIVAVKNDSDKMSTLLQYSKVTDLWGMFSEKTYLPGQGEPGISKPGSTFNGAVNTSRLVKAGEKTVFSYILAWYFPNRYKDWSLYVNIPNTNIWLGNYYAKVWKNINEVLSYVANNLVVHRQLTYKFRDGMFNGTLPWQLVDSAAGRVSVLNSPCCMWLADGNFYAFEGCSSNGGCCPLNCTHVWNFEMALANLYPDLERTMREIDLLYQITPHGVIPSRTICPLELTRVWNAWPDYSTNPASCDICVDGEIGTIFKTYREYQHGATVDWLKMLWNPLKATMDHWLNVLDTDKNGLVYGPQPNTYDVATYGYLVDFGCLYLCGLRSMEEMGKIVGDLDFAEICHDRFELGSANLDQKCFTNGKWYTQIVDPNHQTNLVTTGTVIATLYGQWWAHLLNLGYLLPKEHITSHLLYTYQRNYIQSFDSTIHQAPRTFCDARDSGWINGKWDDGEVPSSPLLYSSEIAWSGVIYPFAALLMTEGFVEEGLDVLTKTRQFYDGTRRSPWNEIECGDHYARAMAAFSLFAIASGQKFSRLTDGSIELKFKPIMNTEDFTGFFTIGTCWGTFTQKKCESLCLVKLKVDYGDMLLSKFTVGIESTKAKVLASQSYKIKHGHGFVSINFEKNLHLFIGTELEMHLY